MKYRSDFEELEPYFQAFWAGEMVDRVAVNVTAPIKQIPPLPNIGEPWLTYTTPSDKIMDIIEAGCANTFYGGLAFPWYAPNLGPDVFSAFLGADLKFSKDSKETSWIDWTTRVLNDYSDLSCLEIKDSNPFYQKILDVTRAAAERGKGKFLIGITDIHGGFDSLAVLRGGPENASMDLVEYPEGVQAAMNKLYDAWQKVVADTLAITNKVQKGTTNWISLWHPGKMYTVQNDFSCLVSNPMYREFFLDELVKEINYLDASIYHLDGVEALQHLDMLLDIPNLNAIQWVRGAKYDNEPIAMWFPLYQKMQAKKKSITVYPKPHEVQAVLDNLKPEGLFIQTWAKDVEEAKTIMKRCGWK
jgi:hypothetical protein